MIDFRKRMLRSAVIFSFALFYPASLPAGLEDFHSRIIQVAFANGYVRALNYDMGTIRVLKESPEDMREYARAAVAVYMREVSELNSEALANEGSPVRGRSFRTDQ